MQENIVISINNLTLTNGGENVVNRHRIQEQLYLAIVVNMRREQEEAVCADLFSCS